MLAVQALNVTFLISQIVPIQNVKYFYNDPYFSGFEHQFGPLKRFSYEFTGPVNTEYLQQGIK